MGWGDVEPQDERVDDLYVDLLWQRTNKGPTSELKLTKNTKAENS